MHRLFVLVVVLMVLLVPRPASIEAGHADDPAADAIDPADRYARADAVRWFLVRHAIMPEPAAVRISWKQVR